MLCPFCRSLNLSNLLPLEINYDDEEDVCTADINISDGFSHHPSFPSLLLSSKNGCTLCTLIARVLQEKQTWCNDDRLYGSKLGESEDALLARLMTASSGWIYLYSVKGSEKQEGAGIWEMGIVATFEDRGDGVGRKEETRRVDAFFWRALEVWREDGTPTAGLKGYANYRTITPYPLSDHASGVLKEWFESCQASHPVCKTHSLHVLPSRVIDVREPCRPRLRLTKGESGQWAALSHCWGNSVVKLLTTASLDEMEKAIPMESLPQNFCDAITITRLLSIDFLWIDSLCIMQDSIEDWRKESAQMADIYKNSTITIAATNAERSSDGFLRDRQPETRCALKTKEGEEMSAILRPRMEWYSSPEIVGPLTQRAWVLQERLLPGRVLHFGGQQMMWQCRTKVLAEGYCDTDEVLGDQKPGDIESLIRSSIHDDSVSTPASHEDSVSSIVDLTTENQRFPLQGNVYNQWYRVVEIYAQLKLTKHTDRLPALAGVAHQVQSLTRDTYLSGIWKSELIRGLGWWYDPPGMMTRPATSRAPSWSWAALDRRNMKEDSDHTFNLSATYHSKYVPYTNEPRLLYSSPDLTRNGCLGSVSGSLTLLGFWRPARLGGSMDSVPERFRLSFPTPLIIDGEPTFCTGARMDTDEKTLDTVPIGCLQLRTFEYIGPKYSSETFISALLLQEVRTSEKHGLRYVRIGMVVIPKSSSLIEGWEKRSIEII